MSVKISRYGFTCVSCQVLLLIIEKFLMMSSTEGNIYTVLGIGIIANLLLELLYFIKSKNVLSIGGLFIISSYIFQCSYALLFFLNQVPTNSIIYTLFFKRYGEDALIKGTQFAIIAIGMVFIGYVLIYEILSNRERGSNIDEVELPDKDSRDYSIYKTIGFFMTVIFGSIYFYNVLRLVVSVLIYGSYSILANELLGKAKSSLTHLEIFYFVGLYLLIIFYNEIGEEKKSKFIFWLAMFSAVLPLFSGSRSKGVVYIILFFSFSWKYIGTFNIKKIALLLIAALLLLQSLVAIRMTRQSGFSISSFIGAFFSMEHNLFYETLNEFGVSVFITGNFMKTVSEPHIQDFFIKELFSVIPKISSWGGEAFIAPVIRTGLEAAYGTGSTYVADYYFYFKEMGQVMTILLGAWIGFWDSKLKKYTLRDQHIKIVVVMVWANGILSTVRSPASFNLKMLLYGFVIIKLFEAFVRKGKLGRM